jgi:hypothetical protein
METIPTSETSVYFNETTDYTPEGCDLHTFGHEKIKFDIYYHFAFIVLIGTSFLHSLCKNRVKLKQNWKVILINQPECFIMQFSLSSHYVLPRSNYIVINTIFSNTLSVCCALAINILFSDNLSLCWLTLFSNTLSLCWSLALTLFSGTLSLCWLTSH